MTLLSIREHVKLLLGSPIPSVVRNETAAAENDAVDRYINQAQDELSTYLGGVEDSSTITLASGTRLYDIPDRMLFLSGARYIKDSGAEKRLYETDHEDLPDYHELTSGEPICYYHEADKIGFYPMPGVNEQDKTVRVHGWYDADILEADTDIPAYPKKYHRLIAMLAAVLILEAQSRFEAQSANSNISADSVSQESRTKEYAFRASDFRTLFENEIWRLRGPRI